MADLLPNEGPVPDTSVPASTPNPLGLTFDQTSALRDGGHISDDLFQKIYPTAQQGAPIPKAPDQAPIGPEQAGQVYKAMQDDQPKSDLGITDPKEQAKFNKFTADGGLSAAAKSQYQNDANTKDQQAKWNADPWKMPSFGEQDVSGTPGQPGDIRTAELKPGDNPNIQLASDVPIKGDQMTMDDMFKQYGPNMSGYDMQAKGVQMAANSGAAKGAEEAAALGKFQKEDEARIQQQQADHAFAQSHLNDQLTKLQTKADQVGSMQVDTHRLFKDKTTGDKIGLGIAMFLGAFGSGGNKAVTVMNEAIDRDIQAQKTNIQNSKEGLSAQQGIYGDMRNLFKDDDAATQATRVAYYNNMQTRVSQIAAKYGGSETGAKAQELLGQIEQRKNDAKAAFAQQVRMLMPVNPNASVNQLTPEQRKTFVPGYGNALTEKGAEEMNKSVAEHGMIKDSVNNLMRILNTPGKSMSPDLRAQAQAQAASLIGPLKGAFFGEGARLNETEIGIIENIAKDPTKITNLDTASRASFKTIMDKANKALAGKARQAGLITPESRLGVVARN